MEIATEELPGGITRVILAGSLDIAGAAAIDLRMNVIAGAHKTVLVDLRRSLFLAGDLHAHGITQQTVGQAGDLLRHGGREQGGFPLRRQRADDPANVLDEAEVEHAIGFVEHET